MLGPEDRRLLVDAVRPDPGFALDHALITTYSLDLQALLSLPLALTFDAWSGGEDGASAGAVDPVALLDALQRHAERFTVLSQAGAIARPRGHGLLSFLEPVVHGVGVGDAGVFHPKFWLLRFDAEETDEVRYRLLVLSRNLTFDRSWDTMLRLDAVLGERPVRAARGPRRVGSFVTDLIGLGVGATNPLDTGRRETLERMAEEAGRLQFELPDGVEACRFWPLGFDRTGAAEVFDGRRDRWLVISPFLGSGFLDELGLGADDLLVARPDELAALPERLRESVGRIAILDPATGAEPEPGDDEAAAPASREDGLAGLHAKLFVADAGWKARAWTGSANATAAAFGENVEFVVELEGPKSRLGVDRILGSDKDGLGTLLVDYFHDPALAPDPERSRIERELDELARKIGSLPLALRASSESGAVWVLELESEGDLPQAPAGVEISVWPATLGDHRAVALSDRAPILWGGLELAQLTGFICIGLEFRPLGLTREVAMVLPVSGLPSDRTRAVVTSVLSDPERVMRYLLFLLGGDDEAEEAAWLVGGPSEEETDGGWLGLGAGPTLLEALVRTLHRDPTRIDRVGRLLEDLGEDGADLLPRDFMALFATVTRAREALAGR
ncbi:MAG: phospholipase D family protein [Actinobacteria bacterium]|nr:phospholipase D family protein [Actinomycetota bacterium]